MNFLFGPFPAHCLTHFFAFSPSSTSRRMASERLGLSSCRMAQESTVAINWHTGGFFLLHTTRPI